MRTLIVTTKGAFPIADALSTRSASPGARVMRRVRLIATAGALLALATSVTRAEQTTFPHYSDSFRKVYWSQLYPRAGAEFYCGKPYAAPVEGKTPRGMTLEHAYPAQWIVKAMHCGANRDVCDANPTSRFGSCGSADRLRYSRLGALGGTIARSCGVCCAWAST